MGLEHEVTQEQDLLRENGTVGEPGWARSLVWRYNKKCIRASSLRIKEWDYYLVTNEKGGLAVTISDLGYMGMLSVSLLDFVRPGEHTETALELLPLGKYGLGPDSFHGNAEARTKNVHIRYQTSSGLRRIQILWKNFRDGQPLKADILLTQPHMDTMAIATPWKENPKCFYYNQKIMTMPARGHVRCGSETLVFDSLTDFGLLDWGRGVWTYDNVWYWGCGSALVNGKPLGMNIGYGFSDRSSATENMLVYDGVCSKLDEIAIDIPKKEDTDDFDYLKPWQITANDGRLRAQFTPFLDRHANTDFKVLVSQQHQVFGHLDGEAILDDGTHLALVSYPCAIERVHNRY